MIDQIKILVALFETFDKSGLADFRRFLDINRGVTKWFIAADFCLHDEDRPNNVYAFSILPYDATFSSIKDEIRKAIPRDWKKSKNISQSAIGYLANQRRFHIAFVLPQPPAVFYNGPGSNASCIARESISLSIDQLTSQSNNTEIVRKLRDLLQKSASKSFNVKLLADIYILKDFICFVTLLLARETTVEKVSWLPDRDNMTTWCDGVIFDLGIANLLGAAQHLELQIAHETLSVALPRPDSAENAMWFDELIRLPDYVAGILAAWNLARNEIPSEKAKYMVMAQQFVASAENIMVFKVLYDTEFQSSRLLFNSPPKETTN
jgi:hypothetical protein